MRLNPDCIRDILLTVEESGKYGSYLNLQNLSFNRLKQYTYSEIQYHVRQCKLYGMFYNTSSDMSGNILVEDLSPYGHEFLANIRNEKIWCQTKESASSIGALSLTAIIQIAANIVEAAIKSHFGLP